MAASILAALSLLAAGAWAGFPACVSKDQGGGYEEPATLQALRDCQDKSRAYHRARGGAKWDRFLDFQLSEFRQYLVRHPDRAAADAGSAPSSPGPAKPAVSPALPVDAPVSPADVPVGGTAGQEMSQESREAALQKERALKAAYHNTSRMPPERGAGYEALDKKLWEMSNDGRAGITPAMAREIVRHLQEQQGGVSVEMQALLDSLQKDGAKLSNDSVLKLKGAARDAKGEGLDLGVTNDMEGWLLDRETDPKAGEPSPSYD